MLPVFVGLPLRILQTFSIGRHLTNQFSLDFLHLPVFLTHYLNFFILLMTDIVIADRSRVSLLLLRVFTSEVTFGCLLKFV